MKENRKGEEREGEWRDGRWIEAEERREGKGRYRNGQSLPQMFPK